MDLICSSRQPAFQWSKNYGLIFQFHSKMQFVSLHYFHASFLIFFLTWCSWFNACGMKGVDGRELCLPSDVILACFAYLLSWQCVCIRSTLCLPLNIILSISVHLFSSVCLHTTNLHVIILYSWQLYLCPDLFPWDFPTKILYILLVYVILTTWPAFLSIRIQTETPWFMFPRMVI